LIFTVKEFTEARAALRDQVPGVPQLPIELAFLRAATGQAPAAAIPTAPLTAAEPAVHPGPAVAPSGAPRPAAPPVTAPASAPGLPGAPARSERAVEAPAPPANAPGDAGLRQAVQAHWDRFLAAAGKRCGMKVQAALRSVKEIDTFNDAILLRFAHTFSRDLVNQTENRAQVEAVWEELLKSKVQVRCALVGEIVAAAAGPAAQAAKPANEDELFLSDARNLGAIVKKLS
jgi:hypothetical protein